MSGTFLNSLITAKQKEIQQWVKAEQGKAVLPLFTSLDIRDAGYKVAHVDANLFPAGFNNLSANGEKRAGESFAAHIRAHYPAAQKILLIPENFTRNLKYLESLLRLKEIIKSCGYEVMIGSPYCENDLQMEQPRHFEIFALKLVDDFITTSNNWQPDLIILNNDLTTGVPDILQQARQPIIPEAKFGWHRRRKHDHFIAYQKIAESFAHEFGFDPWLISTYFKKCGTINFREKQGIECLAKSVDEIIKQTQLKYIEHNIKDQPYVFIKADRGTYGLGMMTAYSSADVLNINKKHRHSMDVIKQGVQNTEIMVQEGVLTIEQQDGFPCESMVYMVAGTVVGNIKRWNVNHDERANLNSHGMVLSPAEFKSYNIKSVIAQLAAIAVSKEVSS
jgi:glutamate--cysteine ligase